MISVVWNQGTGNVRHLWHEPSGFHIYRPNGVDCYTFLHFHNPVKFLTPEGFVTTKPHACIMLAPNAIHDYTVLEPLVHDWIHIDEESASPWIELGLELNKFYYPKSYQFITDDMQRLELEDTRKDPGYEMMIDAKLSEMFIQISRCLDAPLQSVKKKNIRRLQTVRQEMLSSLDEKWTAQRMADALNISEVYVYILYKKIYGVSPTADLIRARISNAQFQLIQTTKSITAIAESLGYTSVDHFSRQFTQIMGISPRDYRKTHDLKQEKNEE